MLRSIKGSDCGSPHTGLKLAAAALPHLGEVVTVPDAAVLFKGEYHRAGADLTLSGSGKTFIVKDYFSRPHPMTLLSPEGAALTGKAVAALAGPEHPGQYAQ